MGDIYRHRWQIELFFKWIKQHFCVKHFLCNASDVNWKRSWIQCFYVIAAKWIEYKRNRYHFKI
ncbi:MAG TPA: hypothetical protein DC024_10640 [Clostridiales bacterium]|nr:hypothetical protein [Clostridiales bacterium]